MYACFSSFLRAGPLTANRATSKTHVGFGTVKPGSDAGACATRLLVLLRQWQPGTGGVVLRQLRSARNSLPIYVGHRSSGRQSVNLHPLFSPLGTLSHEAYSCALRVVSAALEGEDEYAIWGLNLIYSFCSRGQPLHDDWSRPSPGGVSVVVTLDDGGSLLLGVMHDDKEVKWSVAMPNCGDCVVFGAGTYHGGAEYSEGEFPQGHWRLFCYGVPTTVLHCSGDAMSPPGLCEALI